MDTTQLTTYEKLQNAALKAHEARELLTEANELVDGLEANKDNELLSQSITYAVVQANEALANIYLLKNSETE